MDEDDKQAGIVYCDCCSSECEIIYEDCGIGTTEFWGSIATHTDWQWVSVCCGSAFNTREGDEDENER